ncbi:hypothetical protein COHA_010254 [Chlorella ohadii]|uniref:RING-type domain-containing protein n=1 Tax=Chlorella ohadii TaxID=2649997 RepID=A0AAD5DE42_9CHLO|nr:hypothetical protein COHA_010254 [Chlorella ohadii]
MEDEMRFEFDELELREEQTPVQDKGKRPVVDDDQGYSSSDEEEDGGPYASDGAPGSAAGGAEGAAEAAADGAGGQPGLAAEDSEPGDLTCAICLNNIPLENLALIKGCDHMYCATCILHWALHKPEPWCPQCKQPFDMLLTYRTLDGELQDFPTEESVCLLKRARWFEEHLRFVDRGAASLVEESRLADSMAWQDYADDYDLAEDEEVESYYFSSAAGRARVVLGNRRYGEGGFISGGRRQARPVVERKRSNKMGKSGDHAVVGQPGAAGPSFSTPNAGGGRKARPGSASSSGPASGSTPVPAGTRAEVYGSSPAGASASASAALFGSSPSGSGRRARRNARRAAMDAEIDSIAHSPLCR